jgi:hypothetical protein
MGSETELLLNFLNSQRNHVLGILEGLSEDQLRRPVLPSGWSCLGMVKHLALSDARGPPRRGARTHRRPPVDRPVARATRRAGGAAI